MDAEDRKIEQSLLNTARQFPEIVDVHEIKVGRNGEHIHLSCHCTLRTSYRCSGFTW